MQNNMDDNNATVMNNGKSTNHRKKRIKRMKTAIIIIVLALMIIPTICCILLGIQVYRLQKQVAVLSGLNEEYGLASDDTGNDVVYAAQKANGGINQKEEQFTAEVSGDILNANSGNDKMVTGNSSDLENIHTTGISVNDIIDEQKVFDINHQETGSNETNNTEVVNNKEENDDEAVAENSVGQVTPKAQENTEEKTTDSNVEGYNLEGKISEEEIASLSTDIYQGKNVYLTFDDGPSAYTDDILDILADYNVKATFFVIGRTDERSKKLYQRIVNEGHTLGMHSYSHVYKKIYNSVEDFDKDFTKLWKLLYDTTGYKPSIFRFPGGSDNLVNQNGMEDFIRYLNENSIVYFDWNVLNGDATGVEYTKEQLISNVLSGVVKKDNSIVLLHDAQSKKVTVDSLPGLLEALILGNAKILPLNDEVPPIQMIKADTIK